MTADPMSGRDGAFYGPDGSSPYDATEAQLDAAGFDARAQAFEDFYAQLTSDEAVKALREAFNERTEGNYVPHEPMARVALQAAAATIRVSPDD